MAERHEIRRELDAGALEEGVARGAARILDRSAFARGTRGDRLAIRGHRHVERARSVSDERFVAVRRRAELMIEVRDAGKPEVAGAIELGEDVRERHRIAATRHGGDDARARRHEIVLANEAPDAGEQIH
jgi:hypothetical protein